MKIRVFFCTSVALLSSCASAPPIVNAPPPYTVIELPRRAAPAGPATAALMLSQSLRDPNQPQILDVEILPDQGMNIYQIKANIPGLGAIDLLKPGDSEDFNGAIVLNGNILNVGNAEVLPSKNLALQHSFKTTVEITPEHGMITGLLREESSDAPVKVELAVTASIQRNSFSLGVFVKNIGDQPIPIAIGWHPLFRFPKTDRARLRMAIEPQSDSRGVLLPPGETTKYAVELELLRPSR